MDELRKSVQNASYEQKDPLVIYKIEAFELWKKMVEEMNAKAVATLMRGKLAVPDYEESKRMEEERRRLEAEKQQAKREAFEKAQAEAARRNVGPQGQIRQEYSSAGTHNPYANYSTTRDTYPGESAQRQAARSVNRPAPSRQPAKAEPKVGRNDPCPCGSGKKYKNCHGRNQA